MSSEKLAEHVFKFALFCLSIFITGWIIEVLWNAFLVNTIDGVKEITWMTGIGLRCLTISLLGQSNGSK